MTPLGERGGSTITLAEAQALFQQWKPAEYGWLKARILLTAAKYGECHADHLADIELSERNIIGAAVNALAITGLIVSTGEHRKAHADASHGRRSYVYRLTGSGDRMVELCRQDLLALALSQGALPQQTALFDRRVA